MKCDVCRRHLLAAENPETPTRQVLAHLRQCDDCRAWHRRLVGIERHVPLLPVPPSRAKDKLLDQFLPPAPARAELWWCPDGDENGAPEPWWAGQAQPQSQQSAAPEPESAPAVVPLRWWRRPLLARTGVAAAAAVLIASGVFLGTQFVQPPHADPEPAARLERPAVPAQALVARLAECDARLAETASPRQRVEALIDLAEALHQEAGALSHAADAGDLKMLAQMYQKVIDDGIVPQANRLPVGERLKVLDPIAGRLARAEQQARQLARHTPAATAALTQIASAAGAADRRLRDLMKEIQ